MEFVGIFLLLAPLGALILYLRRSAAADVREPVVRDGVEASVATVLDEPVTDEAELTPEAAAEVVEEDAPRRMQV
jgi:hypothetical protein